MPQPTSYDFRVQSAIEAYRTSVFRTQIAAAEAFNNRLCNKHQSYADPRTDCRKLSKAQLLPACKSSFTLDMRKVGKH